MGAAAGRAHRWCSRIVLAGSVSLLVAVVTVSPAAAQQITVSPTSAGLPGGPLVTKVINWGAWLALMASVGAVRYGAALWRGAAKGGNYSAASDGKAYVAGGLIGALLVGLAPSAISTLFQAGQAG